MGVEDDEAVEEALCFGWIDSKPGRLDERRSLFRLEWEEGNVRLEGGQELVELGGPVDLEHALLARAPHAVHRARAREGAAVVIGGGCMVLAAVALSWVPEEKTAA